MTPSDAKVKFLSDLRSAVSVPVSLSGTNDTIAVPGIEVSVGGTQRVSNIHGHRTFAGETTSGGVATGSEHHFYFRIVFDVRVRSKDEVERDMLLATAFTTFAEYEDFPSEFHADAHSFSVGPPSESPLMFTEPNWHEGSRTFTLTYLDRQTRSGDPLESVTETRRAEPDPERRRYL